MELHQTVVLMIVEGDMRCQIKSVLTTLLMMGAIISVRNVVLVSQDLQQWTSATQTQTPSVKPQGKLKNSSKLLRTSKAGKHTCFCLF